MAANITPGQALRNLVETFYLATSMQPQSPGEAFVQALSRPLIVFDIDGVVAIFAEAALGAVNAHYGSSFTTQDMRGYWFQDNLPPEWKDWVEGLFKRPEFYANIAPDYAAIAALQALSRAGYVLCCATDRPAESRSVTQDWLGKWGVPHDGLIMQGHDTKKNVAALHNPADPMLLIDDDPSKIEVVKPGVDLAVPLRPWTPPDIGSDQITVFDNWSVLLNKLGVKGNVPVPQLHHAPAPDYSPLLSTKLLEAELVKKHMCWGHPCGGGGHSGGGGKWGADHTFTGVMPHFSVGDKVVYHHGGQLHEGTVTHKESGKSLLHVQGPTGIHQLKPHHVAHAAGFHGLSKQEHAKHAFNLENQAQQVGEHSEHGKALLHAANIHAMAATGKPIAHHASTSLPAETSGPHKHGVFDHNGTFASNDHVYVYQAGSKHLSEGMVSYKQGEQYRVELLTGPNKGAHQNYPASALAHKKLADEMGAHGHAAAAAKKTGYAAEAHLAMAKQHGAGAPKRWQAGDPHPAWLDHLNSGYSLEVGKHALHPGAQAFLQDLQGWKSSSKAMRLAILADNPNKREAAMSFMGLIHESKPQAPTLWRGIKVDDHWRQAKFDGTSKIGMHFDLALSSFSTSEAVGKSFSHQYGGVVFKLLPGAKALNTTKHGYEYEKEWIGQGRFEVMGYHQDGGYHIYTIKQLHTFEAKAKVSEKAAVPLSEAEFDPVLEEAFGGFSEHRDKEE